GPRAGPAEVSFPSGCRPSAAASRTPPCCAPPRPSRSSPPGPRPGPRSTEPAGRAGSRLRAGPDTRPHGDASPKRGIAGPPAAGQPQGVHRASSGYSLVDLLVALAVGGGLMASTLTL